MSELRTRRAVQLAREVSAILRCAKLRRGTERRRVPPRTGYVVRGIAYTLHGGGPTVPAVRVSWVVGQGSGRLDAPDTPTLGPPFDHASGMLAVVRALAPYINTGKLVYAWGPAHSPDTAPESHMILARPL